RRLAGCGLLGLHDQRAALGARSARAVEDVAAAAQRERELTREPGSEVLGFPEDSIAVEDLELGDRVRAVVRHVERRCAGGDRELRARGSAGRAAAPADTRV